mgnify:CR=1 FL=1
MYIFISRDGPAGRVAQQRALSIKGLPFRPSFPSLSLSGLICAMDGLLFLHHGVLREKKKKSCCWQCFCPFFLGKILVKALLAYHPYKFLTSKLSYVTIANSIPVRTARATEVCFFFFSPQSTGTIRNRTDSDRQRCRASKKEGRADLSACSDLLPYIPLPRPSHNTDKGR